VGKAHATVEVRGLDAAQQNLNVRNVGFEN
jgi:hypothetical protein